MSQKARMLNTPFTRRFINGLNPGSGDGTTVQLLDSLQAITSEGHDFQYLGRQPRNIGGPFTSQKIEMVRSRDAKPQWVRLPGGSTGPEWASQYFLVPVPSVEVQNLNATMLTRGSTVPILRTYLDGNCPLGFQQTELDALGAKAVDMMAPTNPAADLATTLAEFFSERKFFSVPGNAGSYPGEYLNYQFGIAPTVSFAKELRDAISNKEKIIRQYARDSGRWIRRKGVVYKDESEVVHTEIPNTYPGFIGGTPVTQCVRRGLYTKDEVTSRSSWFSGAFTYHLPEEGWFRTIAELDRLYGVVPGMDTAWELLPFSWLVDYKVSAGSAISNANRFAQDGLVMPYGYIMGESRTETTHTWSGEIRDESGSFRYRTLTVRVVKTTKQRQLANPFGFGLLPGDLSTRQWSILAALGLTYVK